MIGIKQYSRRRTDLPFEQDQSTRFLPWIIAPMVFLGVMALAAVVLIGQIVASWDGQVSGAMTVQVPPRADDEMAVRVERAMALILATPGVQAAETMDMEAARALLEPWLGPVTEALPVPAIIEVTLEPGAVLDTEPFGGQLAAIVDGAVVDDHRVWLSSLIDLADLVMSTALAALVLVMVSAGAAVISATRSGLTVHRQIIDLLHHMGAHDGYIARQFQRHVMWLSVRGSALGAGLAAVCLGALLYVGGDVDATFLPPLSLSIAQWTMLALVPIALIAIATLTTRITVFRALEKLP